METTNETTLNKLLLHGYGICPGNDESVLEPDVTSARTAL